MKKPASIMPALLVLPRTVYRLVFLSVSLFFITSLQAQVETRKAVLHFATAEHRITLQHERYLDSFANTLRNIPEAYHFRVTGHTDSVGSSQYNRTLSYQRALSVAAYLEQKGFRENRMKVEARGFTVPVSDNHSEENRERNRRVEIEFRLSPPPVATIAGVRSPSERLEVNDEGATLTTTTGTRIVVPPAAFVDAHGNPVRGKVDIEYKEYRDPIDFLLSDIPMHFNDGREAIPFNSGGMFAINASQGSNPVFLREGKRLNVGFNYDGTVRDQSFFRWDPEQRRWVTLQPLTRTLLDEFKDYMLWADDGTNPSVCYDHPDLVQVFFVQTGLSYSRATNPRIYQMFEAVRLYDMEQATRLQQKQYERKARLMLRKYQVDVEKRFFAKTSFRLHQIRGKRDASSRMLEQVSFRRNLGSQMIDSLERFQFDDYFFQPTDSGLALVLYKGISTITVPGVMIRPDKGSGNFQLQEWLTRLDKNYGDYKALASRYRDTISTLQRKIDFLSGQVRQVFPLTWSSLDTLKCFRMLHTEWMSNDNKKLSLADWLLYYHQNKEKLRAIYQGIAGTDQYIAAEAKVQRFRNVLELYRNPLARLNLNAADVQLPGNFSLSSLGTYNCDQLQRLQDPVILYASYTNSAGKEIRPVVALLIDSMINGVMRYDGSFGYSPYRIAFSARSNSRMVIVDGRGEAYFIKPAEFAKVSREMSSARSHNFIAEPIGKANNKEQLKERLSM